MFQYYQKWNVESWDILEFFILHWYLLCMLIDNRNDTSKGQLAQEIWDANLSVTT